MQTFSSNGYNGTYLLKRKFFENVTIAAGFLFILYCIIIVATQWDGRLNRHFSISLSPSALPHYAILSLGRMAIAYTLSLIFSFIYARLTVKSKRVERIMLPILDILQSIPILSFMPGVVLALVALFPHSNVGLEIAAIILIFTSQAWNITFGFYQTLITLPSDLKEVASINHLGSWQRFTRLELPAGMISLIWNSMMSWAGGWFFLMASEQFTLGHKSFQLPGIGSYLQAAANKGDIPALIWGLGTLVLIIVMLDQLLWRPLVAWGERFKFEQSESAETPRSWFLGVLSHSTLIIFIRRRLRKPISKIDAILSAVTNRSASSRREATAVDNRHESWVGVFLVTLFGALLVISVIGTFLSVRQLTRAEWHLIFTGAGATILRTMAALLISMLWTVPVGVAIGMSPKWARRAQPLVQMTASIPATAIFPALLLILVAIPHGLTAAAVILMLLGTQWYMLFNVIAGAMAIPSDLREATAINHIRGIKKWRILILPAIFPYLVTGMITATGGAWNASIVSEYVTFKGTVHQTVGLGADIASAANHGNFHLLLASTLTMALIVFTINRFGWQRIYHLAENRFHIE